MPESLAAVGALVKHEMPGLEDVQCVPYVGLRSFAFADREFFFGRENQIVDIVNVLRALALKSRDQRGILAIVGESGCGKSSLIRAGLIPALIGGKLPSPRGEWLIHCFTPNGNPLAELINSLREGLLFRRDVTDEAIREQLRERQLKGMGELLAENADEGNPSAAHDSKVDRRCFEESNLLLVVDQFEEILDSVPARDAVTFVQLLLEVTRNTEVPEVVVAISMRAERVGDCARFHGLTKAVLRGLYLVPPLENIEVERAIVGPARMLGSNVDAGLINSLIGDPRRRDRDYLPLLQHSLLMIWQAAAQARTSKEKVVLAVAHYRDACRGKGHEASKQDRLSIELPLINSLEACYDDLAKKSLVACCEAIFRCLVKTPYGGVGVEHSVRNPTSIATLVGLLNGDAPAQPDIGRAERQAQRLRTVLVCFEVAGILTTRRDAAGGDRVDLVHEAVIRVWPRSQEWILAEARDFRFFARFVSRSSDELSESDLHLLASWLDCNDTFQSPLPRSSAWARFIKERDSEYWQRERKDPSEQLVGLRRVLKEEHDRRAARRIRTWSFVAVSGAAVIAILGVVAYLQYGEWERALLEREIAGVQSFGAAAVTNLKFDANAEEIRKATLLWQNLVVSAFYLQQVQKASSPVPIGFADRRTGTVAKVAKLAEASINESLRRILTLAFVQKKPTQPLGPNGKHREQDKVAVKRVGNHICKSGGKDALEIRNGVVRSREPLFSFLPKSTFALDEDCSHLLVSTREQEAKMQLYEILWRYSKDEKAWLPIRVFAIGTFSPPKDSEGRGFSFSQLGPGLMQVEFSGKQDPLFIRATPEEPDHRAREGLEPADKKRWIVGLKQEKGSRPCTEYWRDKDDEDLQKLVKFLPIKTMMLVSSRQGGQLCIALRGEDKPIPEVKSFRYQSIDIFPVADGLDVEHGASLALAQIPFTGPSIESIAVGDEGPGEGWLKVKADGVDYFSPLTLKALRKMGCEVFKQLHEDTHQHMPGAPIGLWVRQYYVLLGLDANGGLRHFHDDLNRYSESGGASEKVCSLDAGSRIGPGANPQASR